MACVLLQEYLAPFHMCERGSNKGREGVSGWDLTPQRPGHKGLLAVQPYLEKDVDEGTVWRSATLWPMLSLQGKL